MVDPVPITFQSAFTGDIDVHSLSETPRGVLGKAQSSEICKKEKIQFTSDKTGHMNLKTE